jgi:hypothetical protein
MTKPKKLHPKLRERLGFLDTMSDAEVWDIWNDRANRVCKPCWELKYCPYGPLVEDSPLLPSIFDSARKHIEYLKECLRTGIVGSSEPLTDEMRKLYEQFVEEFDENDYEPDPTGELTAMQMLGHDKDANLTRETAKQIKEQMKQSLETGVNGYSAEITESQRAMFENEIDEFNADDYPEEIPMEIAEMACTVFGHICPVVFNAEKITETTELRRSGRYLPFKTKIRVVRRDNYTCQHCSKHLLDNEVEFDHIIPLAKGGSSEEHNIRLTCFDCNRDKSDKVDL